jgi:hypothetical protein
MLVSREPSRSPATSGKVCRMYTKTLVRGRVCVLSPGSLQTTNFPIVTTMGNLTISAGHPACPNYCDDTHKAWHRTSCSSAEDPSSMSCILAHCRRHSSSLAPDRHSSWLIDGPTHSNQPWLLLTLPFSDTVLPTQRAVIKEGTLPLASPPH